LVSVALVVEDIVATSAREGGPGWGTAAVHRPKIIQNIEDIQKVKKYVRLKN
jgi:hypothetical protein